MFEVDPNLWLQSFSSPWLTAVMRAVSSLGYEWFYIALIIGLAFGVRLRPTLGVLLAVLLAGIATDAAKDGFQLPRPDEVDVRVLHEATEHRALVEQGGAIGWLALPSLEAREAARARAVPDYGFISGHVSAATAMCLALLLFFRPGPGVRFLLCAWPLLMVLSRMYLGRHFLADVLGGLCAGALAAVSAAWLVPPLDAQSRWPRLACLAGGTLALCMAAPFTALLDPHGLGRLSGLVLVLAVLYRHGFPVDDGSPWHRVARIACVCIAYLVVDLVAGWIGGMAGWQDDALAWLPVATIATASVFLAGVVATQRLRLVRPPVAPVAREAS